jgi:hypothetical protein
VLVQVDRVLDIQEISDFSPNRGASVLGRVYVTIAVPPPAHGYGTVRAVAQRIAEISRAIAPIAGRCPDEPPAAQPLN